MDLIGALQSFLRVAETGSFSAVAKERNVTQPAISRQVTALEEHLGTRLVQRTTQAVSLTEEGKELVGLAQELVDSADALQRFSKQRRDRPVGRVRVAMPIPVGIYLSNYVGRLLARYEELSIDVVLRDAAGGLIEEGLDLAIRIGEIHDASLIARRIGTTTAFLVASPSYLKKHKAPRHPSELPQHDCIVHHRWGDDDVWWFDEQAGPDSPTELSVSVRGRFSANNAEAVHRAAVNGHGIALLSHLLVTNDIADGRLCRLLEKYSCRRHPLYVVYPSRRALPPRTRAVIDFLAEVLSEDPVMSLKATERKKSF
jgi:DNA-binding transcriptional LysR family regulator